MNKLTAMLIGAGLVLSGVLGLEVWWGQSSGGIDSLPTPKPEQPVEIQLPEFKPAEASDYEDIIKRPLFSSTRLPGVASPAAPVTAETPVSTPLGPLDLSAVIIDKNGRRVALIRDKTDNKTQRVAQGDAFVQGGVSSGWSVAEVLPDKVILQRQEEKLELILRQYDKVKPAPGKPTVVTPPAPNRQRVPAKTDTPPPVPSRLQQSAPTAPGSLQ